MHAITRRLEFDAGHRVYQHESKCAHVHGHRYVVEVTCKQKIKELDNLGRVIDFSVIKQVFGTWIDDELDHGMILYVKDPLCDVWKYFGNSGVRRMVEKHPVSDRVFDVSEQKHYIMDKNPTAENMAEMLFKKGNELLDPHGVQVTVITVWETPNCRATYTE